MMDKPTVLLLGGGSSDERTVSLRSADNVAVQLRGRGYTVRQVDPAEADFDLALVAGPADVVLPILHGRGGEDGNLQSELERLGIKYLGSGSATCRLTFDKAAYRDFLAGHGIRVASGGLVNRLSFESSPFRSQPFVLKPHDGGSSIDTFLVRQASDEPSAAILDTVFARHGGRMLMETLIAGTELTVGVVGDEALPVIQIIPPEGEAFDYQNKYNGRTQEIVDPPDIPAAQRRRAQDLALDVHRLCGCRHMSRTDMILTAEGELYVLETNTIPGMTAESLLPKAAAAYGLPMADLCEQLVSMALQ